MRRMKHLLAATALTALASPLMAQTMTVVSFGGAYGAAQRTHMAGERRRRC